MAQKIFGFGIGGTGIVGLFIATGIILYLINSNYANLFITTGFGIGLILGLLGIFGVAKKLIR